MKKAAQMRWIQSEQSSFWKRKRVLVDAKGKEIGTSEFDLGLVVVLVLAAVAAISGLVFGILSLQGSARVAVLIVSGVVLLWCFFSVAALVAAAVANRSLERFIAADARGSDT